mmetsp:Transcript_63261/g.159535  ORF Transcript_63261/g.159535 Transcript_63261/m.159535 type:complete len:234 (+) Transcript_63261:224-925(+)
MDPAGCGDEEGRAVRGRALPGVHDLVARDRDAPKFAPSPRGQDLLRRLTLVGPRAATRAELPRPSWQLPGAFQQRGREHSWPRQTTGGRGQRELRPLVRVQALQRPGRVPLDALRLPVGLLPQLLLLPLELRGRPHHHPVRRVHVLVDLRPRLRAEGRPRGPRGLLPLPVEVDEQQVLPRHAEHDVHVVRLATRQAPGGTDGVPALWAEAAQELRVPGEEGLHRTSLAEQEPR